MIHIVGSNSTLGHWKNRAGIVAYVVTRRVSVHEDIFVKSKVRRSGIFDGSIRHHPPQRSAMRLNAVAPIRGNGINVPADASGCNLNPPGRHVNLRHLA